jgi:glycosyltransferase involved in cell wall biosynthesis
VRIGVDATCLWNRRGFGRFAWELLRALLEIDRASEYLLLVDRDPGPGELPEGAEAIRVTPARKVTESAVAGDHRSIRDMLRFTLALRKLPVDLVFFPAVYSYFPLPPGRRSVVCFHDVIAETYPELVFPDRKNRFAWNAKVKLALWQATRLMTVSEASRDGIVEHFGVDPGRVDVITEGADARFGVIDDPAALEGMRARVGIPQDRPYLLFVGGISPHKNLRTLLDAMPAVLRAAPVTLVMVGDLSADGFLDNADALRAQIDADPQLKAHCRFTGYVHDTDLVALYNDAHALVLPSLLEGFGLPALEAMSCGTPVAAANTGSLPEVVGEGGVFFPPKDTAALAAVLIALLTDAEHHARLARNALRQAGRFSWRRGAELALESFRKAVD